MRNNEKDSSQVSSVKCNEARMKSLKKKKEKKKEKKKNKESKKGDPRLLKNTPAYIREKMNEPYHEIKRMTLHVAYVFCFSRPVLTACLSQIAITWLCWILCSTWLSQEARLASVFTCTFKSIGFGEWLVKAAFRNSAEATTVNLPLRILTVAQLLLGSLLASWLAS
jgi:hypothetical protein